MHRDLPGKVTYCTIILRRNTAEVAAANNAWWAELTAKSSRDQFSFPYTMGPLATYRDIPHDEVDAPIRNAKNKHFYRVRHKKEIKQWLIENGFVDNTNINDTRLMMLCNHLFKVIS